MEITEYNKEDLTKGKFILYFYQQGCKPCEEMKPSIQFAADQLDWKVFKVDLKKQIDLVTKYGVTSTPTFLYLFEGKVCAMQVGSCGDNCLEKKVCDDSCPEIIAEFDFEEKILKSKEPVVLEFIRPNCGNCKAMEGKVKEYKKAGNKIFVINPTNKFVEKFGLKNSPTFIAFKDGKEVGRIGMTDDISKVFIPQSTPITQLSLEKLKAEAFDNMRKIKELEFIQQHLIQEINRRENGTKV